MLSLQQAIEIRESIKSYLQATYSFRKKQVAQAFDDFIEHPTQGMFKGPYVSLKLRFVKARPEEIEAIPLAIKPGWPPYDHQVKAWTRLSTQHQQPKPTLITTGTGSGKTESFLYPVLDYCFRQQHRPGIKVIILYPMNALATDQAKRLAEIIHGDERLKGKIRAGLFIGEGNGPKGQFPKTMGPDHVVEHRDTILDSPPDILLTNFKMLDYALMKHNFHRLWMYNLADPGLLRFLVLDELHTYDGAQGTDVANLIRRLKLKLSIPAGQLCAVGTSATIGSGPDSPVLLADYASKIFGETIDTDAVITENRISPEEFFGPIGTLDEFIPPLAELHDLVYDEVGGLPAYLAKNMAIWKLHPDQLSQGLMRLRIVRDLVEVTNKALGLQTLRDILRELSIVNPGFRKLPQWDPDGEYNPKERVIESLLTLIAEAKDIDNPRSPLMYLQVQLWVRELSGVQYTLEEKPAFSFRDRVDAQEEIRALPPWYCRECNSNGWLGVKPENRNEWIRDINDIYEKYFSRHRNVYFLLPAGTLTQADFEANGYMPDDFKDITIHPQTLRIINDDEPGVKVQYMRKLRDNKFDDICPCCNTAGTISIIGTKIPTLSSIAVSQTLATDLDKASDRERKVLAFTNAVQDAAHQAGFIEGRNYRFAMRGAIQQVINQQNSHMRLDQLAETFFSYWKDKADDTQKRPLDAYVYRFYPKDHLGKSSPQDFTLGNTYAPHFLKELDERIRWEIYAEFGINSKIGRTLEKTGASSVFFDPDRLREAVNSMSNWLHINDVSQTIHFDELLGFSNLILHRMRNRGAVDHPFLVKFRTERLSLWDLNWQRDGRHFLNPGFHPRSRFPKLLTNHNSRDNLLDTTRARVSNWFHSYFTKRFPMARVTIDFVNEFYEQWTMAMVDAGILNIAAAGDLKNYAIEPSAIWVKKNVRQFRCNTCEDTQYTNDPDDLVVGGCCVSYRCTGKYEKVVSSKSNYYKDVYNRNRMPRVFAREHTGLLERREREKLEIDFKQRPKFNSVNALVATSTLEMGIDIGDLNTVYNNSVPPLPANFLQRVGRAGRKSGSALVVNFAKNQNHDLYYFTDPLEMMTGEVSTPGCYLEAKDILRRHFTAFCFDSWTSTNPSENAIPTLVRELRLETSDLQEPVFFINRIVKYIRDNKPYLTARFLAQYQAAIRNDIFPEIEEALVSGTFYKDLWDVFDRIRQELLTIEKRRKDIDDEIRVLRLAKGDPLLDEYAKEKKNLNGLRKSILARNVLEHLTNVGILPNYAFPETGVLLHAHVLRPPAEGSTRVSPSKEFELVRSATQAIREFAPENYFYTQGYKFQITGVNTFDWADQRNFHHKRFCSRCDHIDYVALAPQGNCPKCGDQSWGASSNVHTFVKLTDVRSINYSEKATLSDDNDDRDRQLYQVMHHVHMEQDNSMGAWVLKDIPFGIEFVRNATITTTNYGRMDVNDARRLRINNSEVLTKGFVTCKHCGKSVSATHLINNARDYHYGYCKHRDVGYTPEKKDVFEEVYFFREMKTEILKIVLPIQEFNTETDIRMFKAGLELGLKKYFRGNPGHIQIQPYRAYNQRTDRFDRYLLMYDTIPGGTGYLEKLFDYLEFSLLLRLGYEAIRDCSCQLDGHDGCYKCIYSYGNQFSREDLSRARAERWFAKIVEKTEEWEYNSTGLSSATDDGRIEESELEERFVKLLTLFADLTEGVTFRERKESGTVYYELKLSKGDVEALYWIRPQVPLGPKDGIEYSTRPDFLIVCGQYLYKHRDCTEKVKKIAVYLDGYQYHASTSHNVFQRDIAIRRAIARNQQYLSWTLTWDDLTLFEKQLDHDDKENDELAKLFNTSFAEHLRRLKRIVPPDQWIDYSRSRNNMDRLWQKILNPPELFPLAWFRFLGSWTPKLLEPSYESGIVKSLPLEHWPDGNYIRDQRVTDLNALVPVCHGYKFEFCEWQILVNIGANQIFHFFEEKNFDNIEKGKWQLFWSLYNLFQSNCDVKPGEDESEMVAETWETEIYELYEPKLHALIREAIRKGYITADNAEFLDCWLDKDGNILADAALVLDMPRIAVAPNSLEAEKVLKAGGFTIYSVEEAETIRI